jgi:hypothetical protein
MTNFIAKAGIALLISLGAIAGTTSTAAARGPDVGFGIYFGTPGHHYYSGHRHHDRRGCFPGQALRKAERHGVRHARIVRADHRRVVVKGRHHRHQVRMVFANVRGCPLIGR